ncbi:MAG: hypothetical protein HRU13_09385 [Phycisphaerales bacterium]|nr:hypothetical protein [Phycisphaerales bacterium]
MAYHGQIPPKSSLVVLSSGFARYRDDNGQTRVIDDPLTPNPIRRYVPVLCKALRGNELELSDACARLTGVRPESPVIVGIDEWGVHVRAAFDVLRLEFREPATDHDSAWRKAWELLDG